MNVHYYDEDGNHVSASVVPAIVVKGEVCLVVRSYTGRFEVIPLHVANREEQKRKKPSKD